MRPFSLLPFLRRLRRRYRRLAVLLLFGILLPWGVFLKAASEIEEGEGFPGDQAILQGLHAHATPGLDQLALALSRLGGPLPMVGYTALLFGYLWWRKQPHKAWFLGLAMGGASALNLVAKSVLGRPRPALWPSLAPETSFSFPSGHAMGSAALALAVGLLLARARGRWLAWVLGPLLALGVGLSRMYLGVHYPSDVAAGWVASTGWVLSVYFLFSPYLRTLEHLWVTWRRRKAKQPTGTEG